MWARVCSFEPRTLDLLHAVPDLFDGPAVSLREAVGQLRLPERQVTIKLSRVAACVEEDDILTRDEAGALFLYTSDWRLAESLSTLLLFPEKSAHGSTRALPFLSLLVRALAKLPPVPKETVLWRSSDGRDIASEMAHRVGTDFVMWAPASATLDRDSLGSSGTAIAITGAMAVDVSKYSAFLSETEIVIFPGSVFSVADVDASLVRLRAAGNMFYPCSMARFGVRRSTICELRADTEEDIDEELARLLVTELRSMSFPLGRTGRTRLREFPDITVRDASLFLARSPVISHQVCGLSSLGRCQEYARYSSITIRGKTYHGITDFFLESIRLDPLYAKAYAYLACFLRGDVALADGRCFGSQRSLLLEAIRLDPSDPSFFNILATFLTNVKETVALPDGRVMGKRDLYLESIRLSPETVSMPYFNLANCLDHQEYTTLPDGSRVKDRDLYVLSLKNDSKNPHCLYRLAQALLLPDDTTPSQVTLHDGLVLSAHSAVQLAVTIDPDHTDSLWLLARLKKNETQNVFLKNRMLPGHQVALRAFFSTQPPTLRSHVLFIEYLGRWGTVQCHETGRRFAREDIMPEAWALLQQVGTPVSYRRLAESIERKHDVVCANGLRISRRSILAKGIDQFPKSSMLFHELGEAIRTSRELSVTLLDGRVMTARDAFGEAVRLGPRDVTALLALAYELDSDEEVRLADGNAVTAIELTRRALEIDPGCQSAYQQMCDLLTPTQSIQLGGKTLGFVTLNAVAFSRFPSAEYAENLSATMKRGERVPVAHNHTLTRMQIRSLARFVTKCGHH